VLAFNRPGSLENILNQLNRMEYGEDFGRVELVISIDYPGVNASGAVLANREQTVKVAQAFSFGAGNKTVQDHREHRGIIQQWVDAWDPQLDRREACVILEDDLVPSVYAWKWTKAALTAYRGSHHRLGSLAWQRPTLVPALTPFSKNRTEFGCMPPATDGAPYLYKLFATWGFVALRESWTGFRLSMKGNLKSTKCPDVRHRGSPIMPTIYCVITPGKVWSIWFIQYMDQRRLYTLYANMPSNTTLCSNSKAPGLHFSAKSKDDKDFAVLENATAADEAALLHFPLVDQLPIFDWDAHGIRLDPLELASRPQVPCA